MSAHLLIPAFVYTPMISAFIPEKPEFAATTEETVDYFMESLGKDEFYILCPDNETNREIDQKRIQWNALMTLLKIDQLCLDGILITRKNLMNL